jgi:hypothetical protein
MDEFGQIRIGEHPGGAGQGVSHAETAREGEGRYAEDAVGAAVGGRDPIGDGFQVVGLE